MTGAVSFASAGYVCPPGVAVEKVVEVVGTLVGSIAEEQGLSGSIARLPSATGVVVVPPRSVGQIVDASLLAGAIVSEPGLVGVLFDCEEVSGVPTISFVRGDSADFRFVVLDNPTTQSGTWTWQGTTVVLSTDTSGVAVGQWVRAPALANGNPGPFFKITAITPNTDVTVENPDALDIPTAVTGVEAAAPVDLSASVVRATVRQGEREAWKSTTYTDPDGVELTDAAAGEGVWHITPHDQANEGPTEDCGYRWDIETNVQGTLRTSSGTVQVLDVSGDPSILTFSDVAVVSAAREGDILIGTGAGQPANQGRRLITATPSTDSTLTSAQLRTDYLDWATEAAFAFELYRATRKTPDGLRGDLVLEDDSTRP